MVARGGIDQDTEVDRQTLLHLKQRTSMDLLQKINK